MNEPGTLKFDKKKVDDALAIEYFKQNNSRFYPDDFSGDLDSDEVGCDTYGNKIYFHDNIDVYKDLPETTYVTTRALINLAVKIEENADLFCQLEALIRKVPKEEVRNCDIKLIAQNLRYMSIQQHRGYGIDYNVCMTDSTPLAVLGFVAQIANRIGYVNIIASTNTAAVCRLFVNLCHEVGLNYVRLRCYGDKESILGADMGYSRTSEFLTGCAGIITEHADVDSAVDVLLASSTKYPWKIRRLFIQESVYEAVKKVFQWKYSLKRADDLIDSKLKELCTEIFLYEGKLFLFDFVGNPKDINQKTATVITVEAYRTTKELLSLVNNSFCVSLWTCDSSEANEIAFGVDSTMVWVNDFGSFDGPPKSSQWFYYLIFKRYYATKIPKGNFEEKLRTLKKEWLKVDVVTRAEIVEECIEICKGQLKESDARSLTEIQREITDVSNTLIENFVHIENGRICIGIEYSLIVLLHSRYCTDYNNVIKSLIFGTSVLVDKANNIYRALFEMFVEKGLPVIFYDTGNQLDEVVTENLAVSVAVGCSINLTKVVRQNFGTIFAN